MVQRFAKVLGIPKENRERYEELHADVWPGVLEQIKRSNIRNYSIYRYGELLFSYFEYVGDDYEGDMARMAADPMTQKWWEINEPLQQPVSERNEGEWWMDIPEIFHTD